MPVKVFLVEGREIVRLGIKAMLSHERNVKIVGDAGNETETLEKLKSVQPDVILLDVNIPVTVVLDFTLEIKRKYPKIRILIITMNDFESSLTRMLQGGIDGYVLKDTSKDELIFAIEKVNSEGSYMKPELILDVLAKYKLKSETTESVPELSDREKQVLELIAEGLTNIQMAKKLFTSVRTIETRRKKLLDKTGTVNTATLIRFAVLNGLIK